jgi:hypothetical protein
MSTTETITVPVSTATAGPALPIDVIEWAGLVLAPPTNFGTAPTGLVIGGNVSLFAGYSALVVDGSGNLRVTDASVEASLATLVTLLPATAAIRDATPNPIVSEIETFGMLFNGTTWDRARGNIDAVTGDTGTHIVTFNGATQTNYNARGAIITIVLGTVSGTLPTLIAQLQWSPDGGATWITFGAAMTNLISTGQTGSFFVYPTLITSALLGSSQSALIDAALPRTWRVQYTIAGTTPSFAITAVDVNYIL